MKKYRKRGQAQKQLNTEFAGYNRIGNAFIELDEVIRRLQKVQKIYDNEVATLVEMRTMINNILEIVEEEKVVVKKVGE